MKSSFFVFLCVLFLLGSCRKSRLQQETRFVVANRGVPRSLDPASVHSIADARVLRSLHEGLFIRDHDNAPAPGLVERWEVDRAGRVYTFSLKKTTWSDGVPLTSHNFRDAWLRSVLLARDLTPFNLLSFYQTIMSGATAYANGKISAEEVGVRAIDEYTLEVTPTKRPHDSLSFLTSLTSLSLVPIPSHIVARDRGKGEWATDPNIFVGNGPFLVQSWQKGRRITCVPNPNYHDRESVSLDQLVFLALKDPNTAYSLYTNEEIDWVPQLSLAPFLMKKVQRQKAFHKSLSFATTFLFLHESVPAFKKKKVRQALSMAIDRIRLIKDVISPYGVVGATLVPPTKSYTAPQGLPFNPVLANRLLAEAGFPGGQNFPAVKLLVPRRSKSKSNILFDPHHEALKFVVASWKQVLRLPNLTLEPFIISDVSPYHEARETFPAMIVTMHWGMLHHPDSVLGFFSTERDSWAHVKNPRFDKLIREARSHRDPASLPFYRKAEQLLLEETFLIPLYFPTLLDLIDTGKWGGWRPSITGFLSFRNVYLR